MSVFRMQTSRGNIFYFMVVNQAKSFFRGENKLFFAIKFLDNTDVTRVAFFFGGNYCYKVLQNHILIISLDKFS